MKKNILLLVVFTLCFFAVGCDIKSVDLEVKNVQETEISFSVPSDFFSNETVSEIERKDFEIIKKSGEIKIKTTVSNIALSKEVNHKFAEILDILKRNEPELYNSIKDNDFSVESYFNGYPFGAVQTVKIKTSNLDDDFKLNVKSQDLLVLNEKENIGSGEISGKELNNSSIISYNMSSIKSLDIKLELKNNYKTVDAYFEIISDKPVMNDMNKDDFMAKGFSVENQTEYGLILSKNYENTETFDYIFNTDLINFFGVVGKVDIDYSKNIVKGLNVNVSFVDTDLIEDVKLEIITPKKSSDKLSGQSGTSFKYRVDGQISADIRSTSINFGTVIVIFITIIGITFVVVGMLVVRKRGIHIKYK